MSSMTFTATSSNLPPMGLYIGKLTDIEDLGVQEGQYGKQHQLRFIIEMTDIVDSDDEEFAGEYVGRDVWAYCNLTFGPRAKLRKWFQSIAGREIEDGEEVDAEEIIGKAVRFTIAENTMGNPTVSDVAGYRKASKGKAKRKKAKPAPEEYEFDDEDVEPDDDEEF